MSCGTNVRNGTCIMLAVVGLAFFCPTPAIATIISPLNGSFEDDSFSGGYVNQLPTNWSNTPLALTALADPNPVLNHPSVSGLYPAAADGATVLGLESQYYAPTNGLLFAYGVQQNLGTMISGQTYTFAARLSSNSQGNRSFYRISFYNVTEGRELAAITQADYDPSALGSLQSLPAQFSYTASAADAGDTMRLIMQAPAQGQDLGNGWWVARTGVDAVTVTSVPEPSCFALIATGVFGLLAYAWRRQK